MPGADSEWCPWWYEYFEAASLLVVPPWELAGFSYESAADAPACWRFWAFELVGVKAVLGHKREVAMLGSLGGGR